MRHFLDTIKIKFSTNSATSFVQDLKRQVNTYFEGRAISTKANAQMVHKTVTMLVLTFVPYALIMTNLLSVWEMWGLAFIMGLGVAGIGFSIAHDALHGAYSSNARVNYILGLTFELLGASSYLWKIKHNVIHHTYTNIHGIDEDLEVSPFLRLSPNSQHRTFQKYQHFYAFIAYGFSTLHWVFLKDYVNILKRDLGPYRNISHPAKQMALLIVMKIIYYLYMIVLPLLFLDITWWQFVIGFTTVHITASIILGVVFQLAHVVEGPAHYDSEDVTFTKDAWMVHEMKTTSNFGRYNKLLSWYVGGLNFQIEHHLFPKICSIHYPAISSIVERVAKVHGIPYHHQATLWSAIASHYRMLKWLGNPVLHNQPTITRSDI